MSSTSTLDPDFIGGTDRQLGTGHDNDALGPGDSSDSGSDVSGLTPAGVDTDSNGTGERVSVDPDISRSNRDIGVDRIAQFEDVDRDGEADAATAADRAPSGRPNRSTFNSDGDADEQLDFDADETDDGKLGLEAEGEGYAEDLDPEADGSEERS